jgi:peptidyl-prolyl cis-trans isomerase B (cyclophilin B)
MQIFLPRFLVISVLLAALMLGGCDSPRRQTSTEGTTPTTTTNTPPPPPGNPTPSAPSNQFAGLPRLNGKATVVMTVKGKPITIEIDGTNAPITAGNFVELVQKGFYNGLSFHRVEKKPQPFVVQGGDPRGNGTGGYVPAGGSSERQIPLEIKAKGAATPSYSTTANEEPNLKQPVLQHKRGAIAMARSGAPDSASSQFYFTLSDIDFLDGSYAVFGKIVQGVEVIDTIAVGDKIQSAKVTKGIENLKK